MIEQIPMFVARCDVCNQSTFDQDADYAGWASEDAAMDEWAENDFGVTYLDTGCVCWVCIPDERCPQLDAGEGHTWEAGGGDCGEGCGRNVADVIAAMPGTEQAPK